MRNKPERYEYIKIIHEMGKIVPMGVIRMWYYDTLIIIIYHYTNADYINH